MRSIARHRHECQHVRLRVVRHDGAVRRLPGMRPHHLLWWPVVVAAGWTNTNAARQCRHAWAKTIQNSRSRRRSFGRARVSTRGVAAGARGSRGRVRAVRGRPMPARGRIPKSSAARVDSVVLPAAKQQSTVRLRLWRRTGQSVYFDESASHALSLLVRFLPPLLLDGLNNHRTILCRTPDISRVSSELPARRTRESNRLRYAVNWRVAGSSPA